MNNLNGVSINVPSIIRVIKSVLVLFIELQKAIPPRKAIDSSKVKIIIDPNFNEK